jgi:hypothetical protein
MVTGNAPTAEGGRVVRISGRSVVAQGFAPAHQLQNAQVYDTAPQTTNSPNADALARFNAMLAKD